MNIKKNYENGQSIKAISQESGLSEYKVRKLLVSEGVITSDYQAKINQLSADGLTAEQIAEQLHVSAKAIIQRMPYTKGEYNADMPTQNALTIRKMRKSPIAVNRRLMGLSQTDLAVQMGVTQKDVSRWETGVYVPSTTNAIKLSEILQCEIKDLIK